MKIGLFFGSFNPVHVGHMIIANHLINNTDLDKLWMVVSPQSPFKKRSDLTDDDLRLHMVNLAIGPNENIKASDIEFDLAKPSYTIDTLNHLKEKFPSHEFVLIMGGDNLKSFHRWKNYEEILSNHQIYVYQRPNYKNDESVSHQNIKILEAPLLQISSTAIRNMIKHGQSFQYLVTDAVYEFLLANQIYSEEE